MLICNHHERDGFFLEAANVLALSNVETSQKFVKNFGNSLVQINFDTFKYTFKFQQYTFILLPPLRALFCIHSRVYSNEYKLKLYLRIARLYMKANDFKLAESFVNRSSIIQVDSVDPMLLIDLKVSMDIIKSYMFDYIFDSFSI